MSRRALLVAIVAFAAALAAALPHPSRAGDPEGMFIPIPPPDSATAILEKLGSTGEKGPPRPLDPVNQANRLIMDQNPNEAIAVCKAHLKPDSSDAPLRAMLGWAYIARDRVCLPLPPSLEEYVKASMLLEILVASGLLALEPGFERFVFDMSVGYDLKGI